MALRVPDEGGGTGARAAPAPGGDGPGGGDDSGPTVAVIGAAADRRKYGNKAVRAFRNAGYDVYPINLKEGEIEGLRTYRNLDELPVERLDSVSIYVPPETVLGVSLDECREQGEPGEVWLNPGTPPRGEVTGGEGRVARPSTRSRRAASSASASGPIGSEGSAQAARCRWPWPRDAVSASGRSRNEG